MGRLAIWMAEQSENDPEDIRSPLAQYADNWATEIGAEALDPAILFNSIGNLRRAYFGLIALMLLAALAACVCFDRWLREICTSRRFCYWTSCCF